MTNKNNIDEIISRIAEGNYSEEDLRQYNTWCNVQQRRGDKSDWSDQTDAIFRFVKKRIASKRQRYISASLVTIAAALLLFLLIKILWEENKNTDEEDRITLKIEHQIPEGFDGVVLTLSNGDTVHVTSEMKQDHFVQNTSITTISADHTLHVSDAQSGKGKKEVSYNTLATSRGQQFQITLSDGTKVWLNAASSIRYPLSFSHQKERKVEFTGEAYFEVAKNAKQPFIVASRSQQVKVLGTHFNINCYADEPLVKTTLVEGAVEVNQKVILLPGEQSRIDDAHHISKRNVDTDVVTAWKNGYFEFRNENIYEIMRKVTRFHNIEVVYEGIIPLEGMSGQIRIKDDLAKILDILGSTKLLKITYKDNLVYIRKT
ncbi:MULTISPECIES: FecR family protein [unclassified Sphingobacterium]|uniref:FecR family protein n=1 Tax=unclassified Sphingobacterium TaxID=2609468 RepID=UPI0025CD64CC|nr:MULTISPECIES: FecR domain-containing protein [unclassified Sphingobacterium]